MIRGAARILRAIIISGRMDDPAKIIPGSINTPEHQALARELAEESVVLLKNEGDVLPLDAARIKSIAVIGPNAAECRLGGGGSSYLKPPYRVTPLEGIKHRVGEAVQVSYELGCTNIVQPTEMDIRFFSLPGGKGQGLKAEYFAGADFSAKPVFEEVVDTLNFHWVENGPVKNLNLSQYAVRLTGVMSVPVTGEYQFVLFNTENCKLFLEDRLLIENNPPVMSFLDTWVNEEKLVRYASANLEAGKPYAVRLEFTKYSAMDFSTFQLFYMPPDDPGSIEKAASLAAACDVAVVFAGMPVLFELEGHDRPHMDLPGRQTELIRAVVTANPHSVVVVNAGSPVTMPWLDEVPAVLEAFYPGQEGGHALARILFGEVNPSGKLTVTFPKRLEDSPAFINFPGEKEVFYGEGIFVGYRYFDKKDIQPLFPFGFGLSYTSFGYSDLQVTSSVSAGEPVKVALKVTNTGQRAGKEIVQVYVSDKASSLVRPPKELKAFKKVALKPGESQALEFELDQRALSFYDPYRQQWVAEPGEFEILVGSSSRDIRQKASFTLK